MRATSQAGRDSKVVRNHGRRASDVSGGSPSPAHPAGRIVVVDDEPDIREAIGWALTNARYEVVTARNGADAVDAVHAGRFDLVITDFRMPGMNGAETIEAMRAIDPGMRAIVASAFAAEDELNLCLRLGATGWIRKPFTLRELLRLVRSVLAAPSSTGSGAGQAGGS